MNLTYAKLENLEYRLKRLWGEKSTVSISCSRECFHHSLYACVLIE